MSQQTSRLEEAMNRRQFVKVAGGATISLAAFLAGCGSSTGGSTHSNRSAAIEVLSVQQAGTGRPPLPSPLTHEYAKKHPRTTLQGDFAGQTYPHPKVQFPSRQGGL